jgi:hypothetical protein
MSRRRRSQVSDFKNRGLKTSSRTQAHHHQITKLSHSINAIGPAPHRSGRKREHRTQAECKLREAMHG